MKESKDNGKLQELNEIDFAKQGEYPSSAFEPIEIIELDDGDAKRACSDEKTGNAHAGNRKAMGAAASITAAVLACVIGGGALLAASPPANAEGNDTAQEATDASGTAHSGQASLPSISEVAKPAYRQTATRVARDAEISLDATIPGWDEDGSTPLLVHVWGRDDIGGDFDAYCAFAAGSNSLALPEGRYKMAFAAPVNADGSLYKTPGNISVAASSSTATIDVALKRIKASKAKESQVKTATRRITSFVKAAPDDAFDGEGADILERAFANAAKGESKRKRNATEDAQAPQQTQAANGATANAQSPGNQAATAAVKTTTTNTGLASDATENAADSDGGTVSIIATLATDDFDDIPDSPTTSADKTWVEEKGHYEGDALDGKAAWVVDEPGHWE